MPSVKITQAVVEFICVELYSIVIGAGLGFIQGICAFSTGKIELWMHYGWWGALPGAVVASVLFPLLYYSLMRKSLSLPVFIEMSSLIFFVGILFSIIGGWSSALITIVASAMIAVLYCGSTFRIVGGRKRPSGD